ncbi:major capsid protein [Arthrobacter sp. N1]|uniref:major capsid protein n=1 Tax=Arthrobacter sp. N1 TaxID=619291 RepID=UPI003BAF15A5
MPVTLEQSKQNATQAYDPSVIDEFRKSSFLLDQLTFDDVVSPAGGGATLDYGYRRLVTQPTAAFRAINAEYVPTEVTTSKHSVELKVLGGSFQIDRVLAKIGPAASGEVALQMSQKIKAARTKFCDAVINGDGATEAESFDGLSKALAGSSTEYLIAGQAGSDWAAVTERAAGVNALKHLRKLAARMDGTPSAFLMNEDALATLQTIAEFVSQLGTLDAFGQTVTTWRGIPLVDLGEKPGTSNPVIPTSGTGTTDIYAVRMGLDGFHGVSTVGGQVIQSWLTDFTKAGAVKTGEVEMGPVAVALKATKAAAVLRGVKVA